MQSEQNSPGEASGGPEVSPGGAGAAYVLGPPKLSAAETQLEEAKARPINATDARPAPRTSRQPVKTGATEAARKPLQGQPLSPTQSTERYDGSR